MIHDCSVVLLLLGVGKDWFRRQTAAVPGPALAALAMASSYRQTSVQIIRAYDSNGYREPWSIHATRLKCLVKYFDV